MITMPPVVSALCGYIQYSRPPTPPETLFINNDNHPSAPLLLCNKGFVGDVSTWYRLDRAYQDVNYVRRELERSKGLYLILQVIKENLFHYQGLQLCQVSAVIFIFYFSMYLLSVRIQMFVARTYRIIFLFCRRILLLVYMYIQLISYQNSPLISQKQKLALARFLLAKSPELIIKKFI